MNTQKATFKLTYNGKNITKDVSGNLLSCSYSDKTEGSTDEIVVELEDTDALWRGEWYPEKAAKLTLEIDSGGQKLKCGTFELDEITQSGPPHVVSIKAIAAGISKALRTKKSKKHENQTLKDIAISVAGKYGLTVQGSIEAIQLNGVIQHRQTDLAFLKKLSLEYGYVFSIRSNKLVFTNLSDLEKGKDVLSVDLTEMSSYSFTDKAIEVYKDSKISYHNPKIKQVVASSATPDQIINKDGISFPTANSSDTKVIHVKAENQAEAKAKAKAVLYRMNTKQNEGSIDLPGNTLLVAGVCITVTGLGVLSGKYSVLESTHSISKSGGYTTSLRVKRVGNATSKAQQQPKKIATPKVSTQGVSAEGTGTITNRDGITFPTAK